MSNHSTRSNRQKKNAFRKNCRCQIETFWFPFFFLEFLFDFWTNWSAVHHAVPDNGQTWPRMYFRTRVRKPSSPRSPSLNHLPLSMMDAFDVVPLPTLTYIQGSELGSSALQAAQRFLKLPPGNWYNRGPLRVQNASKPFGTNLGHSQVLGNAVS